MADPYIGEIRAFAFGFVPQGWLGCDGSQLMIQQYPALYATIGPRFGGDGQNYFNLPDLRARAVTSQYVGGTIPPNAPGGYTIGAVWGANAVVLSQAQMPVHTHVAKGYGAVAGVTQVGTPDATTYLGLLRNSGATILYDLWSTNAASNTFAQNALGLTGGGPSGVAAPHNNNQPYLPLNFCICWDGNFMPNPN